MGVSGDWTLKAPLDTKITPNLAYTCKSLRKISEMVANGIDVLNLVYIPNGLTQDDYNDGVANDWSVVTLQAASGLMVLVPSPWLAGWPSADSVPYVVMGMIINLGAIPNTIDPTFLTDKVEPVIKAALGLDPEIHYATLSETATKTWDDHVAQENARTAAITDENSDYIKRVNAEADLAAAQAQIAALQQVIIDAGLTIPTSP
jgi:hypothetical protein